MTEGHSVYKTMKEQRTRTSSPTWGQCCAQDGMSTVPANGSKPVALPRAPHLNVL